MMTKQTYKGYDKDFIILMSKADEARATIAIIKELQKELPHDITLNNLLQNEYFKIYLEKNRFVII